jgi:hypothetical protein
MKETFNQLVKGFNKTSVSNDLTSEQTIVVIKHIVNSKLDDIDKRNLVQEFLLNWLTLEEIKQRM